MNVVAFGRYAQFFVANPGQRANVAAGQLVHAHHVKLGLHDFFFRKRNFHAQNFGAVKQALGMLFQAEDTRAAISQVVGAHAFKSAAAVVQGVGEHMDFGVAPFDHLAVHPNFAIAVGH